jgi:hypothetical protein
MGDGDKNSELREILRKANQAHVIPGGFINERPWAPPVAPAKRCTCKTCPCCGGQIPTVSPYQPSTTPWINIGTDPNSNYAVGRSGETPLPVVTWNA